MGPNNSTTRSAAGIDAMVKLTHDNVFLNFLGVLGATVFDTHQYFHGDRL